VEGCDAMTWELAVLIVSLLLIVYLFWSLIRPEHF
jgi:K+-transporting ATPase KdpF subunit